MVRRLIADVKLSEEHALDMVKRRISRGSKHKDFLTRILEQRDESISDVQLAAHSADFGLAGSETTATALACITYYLLREKTVASKLKQEIRGALRSYSDIDSISTAPLKYLNAVCLEGMRIWPTVPVGLPRVVSANGHTIDGHFVTPGVCISEYFSHNILVSNQEETQTIVSVNPMAACLHPANFKDPFTFKPERWLEHNGYDKLEASQPFLLGPRGCLGRKYAFSHQA